MGDVITCGPTGKKLADEYMCLTPLVRVCRLNTDLESVVSEIRQLPGLSKFLLPSPFSDLRRTASGGPVVIVNASKYSCDVLVLSVDMDPFHIPLSIPKGEVGELSSALRALTLRAKKVDVDREQFSCNSSDQVVFFVADRLRSTYPLGSPSRVWWCPTAEFSLLPLHVASPYRGAKRVLQTFTFHLTPQLFGYERSADEVIHLGAAMQFAGFRSMIGTMWAVDDAQANKTTSSLYEHMVDVSRRWGHTRAAYALWKTMRSVRHVLLDQPILHIHIGV